MLEKLLFRHQLKKFWILHLNAAFKYAQLNSKKIGQSSFESSSIPRIKIPSTVTSISGYAFSTCQKLEYVEFEKDAKIENFGFYAFFNSAIKHFTCPATANNIGGYMLQQCDDLICAEFPKLMYTQYFQPFLNKEWFPKYEKNEEEEEKEEEGEEEKNKCVLDLMKKLPELVKMIMTFVN